MGEGDIRVLMVMNLILSSVFAYIIVWGLSFIGVLPGVTAQRVAIGTLLLMVVTWYNVLR